MCQHHKDRSAAFASAEKRSVFTVFECSYDAVFIMNTDVNCVMQSKVRYSMLQNTVISHISFSFHFILNSLYRVKSTITIDLQAALLKT